MEIPVASPLRQSSASSVASTTLTASPAPVLNVAPKRPFDFLDEVITTTRPTSRVAFRVDGMTVNIDHVQDFFNVTGSARFPHDLHITRNYNLVGVMLGRKDDDILPLGTMTKASDWKALFNFRGAKGPSITAAGSPTAAGKKSEKNKIS